MPTGPKINVNKRGGIIKMCGIDSLIEFLTIQAPIQKSNAK